MKISKRLSLDKRKEYYGHYINLKYTRMSFEEFLKPSHFIGVIFPFVLKEYMKTGMVFDQLSVETDKTSTSLKEFAEALNQIED